MAATIGNPFTAYLNCYTTASPKHEAAFDEFTTQSAPPSGKSLSLDTKIEQFLRACAERKQPRSIILTGNAGDGKTYLCRRIIETLTGEPVSDWTDRMDWRIDRHGLTLRVCKDLSEMGEEAGANVLHELAHEYASDQPRCVFLIAANEGRLRAVLGREQYGELYEEVDRQLQNGPDLNHDRLLVMNLNQITTSTYVPMVLNWLTDPAHWQGCQDCPALPQCPIHLNASRLAEAHAAHRLQRLYQVIEHLDMHITIRDMLIHLAYTVTGGQTCEAVIQASRQVGWEAYHYAYYENVWGEAADETFRRKAVVIQRLRRLDAGKSSIFAVDDLLINGQTDDAADQPAPSELLSPALDLGGQRFAQDRDAYLRGGEETNQPSDEHPLMKWLPHCRRKLFFEWQNTELADRLLPFLYLPDYFRLLNGNRAALDRYRRDLIVGLNRTLSGLFLTDSTHLYITSQYAHSAEQPVPIVIIKIPEALIGLRVDQTPHESYDRDLTSLVLTITPPPPVQAEPIDWPLNLLRFEYLMRRSRGGTPNVLAAECELVMQQLKDALLSRFGAEEKPDHIDFFRADRSRYTLQTLWLEPDDRIHV